MSTATPGITRKTGTGTASSPSSSSCTTSPSARDDIDLEQITHEDLIEKVLEDVRAQYQRKEEDFSAPHMRELERVIMMGVIDSRWREHLYDMDYLREGIHWRSLSQKDPLVEYKSEGFTMFQELLDSIKQDFVRTIFHVNRVPSDELAERRQQRELAVQLR